MALPIPNLDNRRFDELVEEARKLIPVYAPGWTDFNAHDPGITIVEVLAWLVEMQLYHLDRVTDGHLIKYLSLLGVELGAYEPARVEVTVPLPGDFFHIPGGAVLLSSGSGGSGEETWSFETLEGVDIVPLKLDTVAGYFNYEPVTLTTFNEEAGVFYYGFSEYPGVSDYLCFGFDATVEPVDFTGKRLRLGIHLYEDDLPARGGGVPGDRETDVTPSAETVWEYWHDGGWSQLEVEAEFEAVKVFSQSGYVEILLPGDWEKGIPQELDEYNEYYWIRCGVKTPGYEIPPRIDRIVANGFTIAGGRSREDIFESDGLPDQEFKTLFNRVIRGSVSVRIDPGTGVAEPWQEVKDFDCSGPEDCHFVVEYDPAQAKILLGSQINGAVPPGGSIVTVSYRADENPGGVFGPGELTVADMPDVVIESVFPGTTSTGAESIDEAFLRYRRELKNPCTAVTAEDYEAIALATPGLRVARAKAVIEPEAANRVSVAVVPYSFSTAPLPGEGFKRTVCRFLDRHRLITTPIEVTQPDYVKVWADVEVTLEKNANGDRVKARILEALDGFLCPLNLETGGGWPFGRPVYRSEVFQLLENVKGVDCIPRLILSASGGTFTNRRGDIVIEALTLVYPGAHRVEVLDRLGECNNF